MELTTRKRQTGGIALALLLAAALIFAGSTAGAEEDWTQRSGLGYADAYYTALKDLKGGGFSMGGEYINSITPWGLGADFNLALLMHDEHGVFTDDVLGGLDIYFLARAMDVVTLYIGIGGVLHNLEMEFDNDVTYGIDSNSSHRSTKNVFVGARWVFAGRCFLFAEYRRESGSIWLSDNSSVKRSNQLIKYDMSGNRVVVGIGAVF